MDALANQFGFGDMEQDLRKNLHGFAKLGRGLSKPNLATRTYLLGGIFCVLKEQRMIAASHLSTQHLLTDLQIHFEATFSLSPEQRTNIRIVAGDLIFDPNRITVCRSSPMTLSCICSGGGLLVENSINIGHIRYTPAHEKNYGCLNIGV